MLDKLNMLKRSKDRSRNLSSELNTSLVSVEETSLLVRCMKGVDKLVEVKINGLVNIVTDNWLSNRGRACSCCG